VLPPVAPETLAAIFPLATPVIRGVIFDLDGVLIDSEPLWREAEIELFGAVGVLLDDEDCRSTMGLRVDEVVDHWFARRAWVGPSPAEMVERVVGRVAELIAAQGRVLPGALDLVGRCRARGLAVGLASSSYRRLIDVALVRAGLQASFDTVQSAEHEDYGKPHPGIYLAAASALGCAPAQCLAIEDSLNGVVSAKAARMRCLAVPEQWPDYDPRLLLADRLVGSLTEVDDDLLTDLLS
jgi:mannitol-1-/sugar-/sorbitol-6-/2-deoxyglucose-6-phosphatase